MGYKKAPAGALLDIPDTQKKTHVFFRYKKVPAGAPLETPGLK